MEIILEEGRAGVITGTEGRPIAAQVRRFQTLSLTGVFSAVQDTQKYVASCRAPSFPESPQSQD